MTDDHRNDEGEVAARGPEGVHPLHGHESAAGAHAQEHQLEIEDLPEVPPAAGGRRSVAELAFGEDPPTLLEAMGGPVGMVESATPPIAFVIAVTVGASVPVAAGVAVATALVLTVARLLRRETVQFALTGLLGVAIAAGIAIATGQAKDYFLVSFGTNIVYGLIALGSVLAGRPFVGYVAENLSEERDPAWRQNPAKLRRYRLVSLIWAAIFTVRLVVQIPIYLTDDGVAALGAVKLAMSYPLFGLGLWLSWYLVRKKAMDAAVARG